MPPRKYALAGEPDFHNLSDQKMRDYEKLIQDMLFAYPKRFYPEQYSVLSSVWHEVSCENTRRLAESAIAEINNPTPPKPIKVIRKTLVSKHKVI